MAACTSFFSLLSAKTPEAKVVVDLSTQRFLDGESSLDREKYFNIHSNYMSMGLTPDDMELLVNELDVSMGRVFNGPFWYYPAASEGGFPSEAEAKALSRAIIDRTQTHPLYPYQSNRVVYTDHPRDAFSMDTDPEAAAEWAAAYFQYFFSDVERPAFYEPMNEPFVHTGDFGEDHAEVRERMAVWFREFGKAFKERDMPVQVVGYASAWPSMELWDFKHWNERMKMFMDVAGDYMDGFSVHLYDGTNVTGQDNRRSGSNAEAILDLIETYSFIKWGRVKPHALTEYGDIVKGFPEGYSDEKSSQGLRAINHLLFTFLERQDRISTSIPFITSKSPWFYGEHNNYQPYGADLWRPDPDSIVNGYATEFLPTMKMYFYELWAGVHGERVVAYSDDPDVMVRAFVDGKDAFICLNNLNDEERRVSLEIDSVLPQLDRKVIRRLDVPNREVADYSEEAIDDVMDHIDLQPQETVILIYTASEPFVFDAQANFHMTYSKTYMQPIVANKPIVFEFNDVPTGEGRAFLRMSIGRKHDRSKQPIVKVNGINVPVPENWAGYDQANRSDFFGAIEIPVPMDAIRDKTTVSITFPDSGGHLSSLVLATETLGAADKPLKTIQ
ncbi:hypothetical protein [Rubellicoccus peritrichatus]|uniref:Beta-agarase n=1 Tax=Rubellicoccus peritrichatus TaxID=3080537 RepID=A0AAQ3L8Z8_9BACT|nr:hypothetical protein [Puniceicoccus sp. CR14]WOO40842.1 hypothetical protein RZN69_19640 [Puniceicoccus sp. CR14]